MRLNLRKLLTGEASELSFSDEIDLSNLEFGGEKPLKAPVKVLGTAEDRAGVIFLEADISLKLETACARCVKTVSVEKTLHISHILSEDVQNEEDDEILKISDGTIELDEPVVAAVVLGIDMRYLCSEDCRGLCPKCGKNLNEGDCGCPKEIDPRWEALAKLFN